MLKLWRIEFATYYGACGEVLAESPEQAKQLLMEYGPASIYKEEIANSVPSEVPAVASVVAFDDGELA